MKVNNAMRAVSGHYSYGDILYPLSKTVLSELPYPHTDINVWIDDVQRIVTSRCGGHRLVVTDVDITPTSATFCGDGFLVTYSEPR